MARFHGRNAAAYVDQSAGANSTATMLAFQSSMTINGTRDKTDVTAFGDGSKVYLAGLADAQGTVEGFVDDESNGVYRVADGIARKFYWYQDASSVARMAPISGSGAGYWYGTATFDVTSSIAVNDATKSTLNWAAASTVYKV